MKEWIELGLFLIISGVGCATCYRAGWKRGINATRTSAMQRAVKGEGGEIKMKNLKVKRKNQKSLPMESRFKERLNAGGVEAGEGYC